MAIYITEACINCGACVIECPNQAIYEPADSWRLSDGTKLSKVVAKADQPQPPLSDDIFFIVPDKCTECVGFHEEPQCASVCPADCCLPDPEHRESTQELLLKQQFLHQILLNKT
ncbi:MAG: 4Fe-4S dicluster domain-containing protein [Cytophagales bacterium]|nr:MAG: 4Fe-4S dicluster domain-containing protein [Cytophagales bacterium]TAF60751.1 MAG: 4Fe-4S dicluster domain-containing protein [Cytophagales bacterium]